MQSTQKIQIKQIVLCCVVVDILIHPLLILLQVIYYRYFKSDFAYIISII